MNQTQKVSLFLLRITAGWLFFYAGITKLINPEWSAAGYLNTAKTFPDLFHWFASPGILPIINFINEWGLTLLGISLILGIAVRLSSILGIVLMILYYLPILDFPYPNTHSYIVDEHIIYSAALLVLIAYRAGRAWGLEKWCLGLSICSRSPLLRKILG